MIDDACETLWKRVLVTKNDYHLALSELLKHCRPALAELVARSLGNSSEGPLAVEMAEHLNVDELKEIFPTLLKASSEYGPGTGEARRLLMRIPKEWILERIERETEPILQNAYDEQYWCLHALYVDLGDMRLVEQLAKRAIQSSNPHVQEAGRDFLEQLRDTNRRP